MVSTAFSHSDNLKLAVNSGLGNTHSLYYSISIFQQPRPPDFLAFGVVSGLVFQKTFVPPQMDSASRERLIDAIFFVGFAARPVGGVISGHFGDRVSMMESHDGWNE